MQDKARLYTCIILSLSIHALLLAWMQRPSVPPTTMTRTLTVQLTHRPTTLIPAKIEAGVISKTQHTRPSAPRPIVATAPAAQPNIHAVSNTLAVTQADTPATPQLDLEQLRQQAHTLARDEARHKPADTPSYNVFGELKKSLRESKQEIRLANGMLKIIHADGRAICFQAPPVYARDVPRLFGTPSSCP